jgi:hypothetical protein
MATNVTHRLPTPQDQAIADLTGYEDAATLRWQQACVQAAVVFQKWRWPFLHRPPKGIAVDKQANHDVMHLRRFREADRLAD